MLGALFKALWARPHPMKLHIDAPAQNHSGLFYPRLAKRPLVFNGRLDNRWFTPLVKEATVR